MRCTTMQEALSFRGIMVQTATSIPWKPMTPKDNVHLTQGPGLPYVTISDLQGMLKLVRKISCTLHSGIPVESGRGEKRAPAPSQSLPRNLKVAGAPAVFSKYMKASDARSEAVRSSQAAPGWCHQPPHQHLHHVHNPILLATNREVSCTLSWGFAVCHQPTEEKIC